MFVFVTPGVLPIIEDLTAENVPSDPPSMVPSAFPKNFLSHANGVSVDDLVCAVTVGRHESLRDAHRVVVSRLISKGLAGGRCVALTRFGAAPSLKVRAERRVSAGDSELPYTTSTRKPEGSVRRERRPPPGSRQVSIGEAPGSCEILIRSVSLGTHSPKPTNFALGARCTR